MLIIWKLIIKVFSSILDMLYTLFLQATSDWNWKKNEAKAKQHPEAELLLVKNYLLSFLSFASFWFPKITGRILKNLQQNKCVYFNEIIWLIIIKVKKKNRLHRLNTSTSRHGLTYTKCKKCLVVMMLLSIKQHSTNTLRLNS